MKRGPKRSTKDQDQTSKAPPHWLGTASSPLEPPQADEQRGENHPHRSTDAGRQASLQTADYTLCKCRSGTLHTRPCLGKNYPQMTSTVREIVKIRMRDKEISFSTFNEHKWKHGSDTWRINSRIHTCLEGYQGKRLQLCRIQGVDEI